MNKRAKIACITIGIGLLIYSILRAFHLSFTHDESYTYLYASQNSFMEIISNRTKLISANNHILNTLLMKFFEMVFGSSDGALRLQSIIAHAVYMCFCLLLLKPLRSNVAVVLGFIILNVNPYMIEFFSLARGYALAISFMLISIYYLIAFFREEQQKHIAYALLTACLAVLSNFGLFYYFGSILMIHFLFLVFKYKNVRLVFSKSKPVLITLVLMTAICYEPIRKLIIGHQLEFGGNTGIWHDTVISTINASLYSKPYSSLIFKVIEYTILIVPGCYFLLLAYKFFKKLITPKDKAGFLFLVILFSIIFLNVLCHILLKSPFLNDRYALFILPPFIFVMIFLFDELTDKKIVLKTAGYLFLISISAAMTYHFGKCANLTNTTNWRYDSNTKNMINDLTLEKQRGNKDKIRLGITWEFEPSINFYRETRHLDWLEEVNRKGIMNEYDYYYIGEEDYRKADSLKLNTLKEYPISITRLLKQQP